MMDNLKQRKEINVDPFQSGFKHMQKANNIDLSVVRLCFQVFLPDENGKITRTIPPVVSHPIHDKKSLKKLIIRRVDKSSGRAKGGDEVFLLCENIKDDVRIRFYQENSLTNDIEWEDFGDFSPNDIHRQGLIVDFSVKADCVDGLSKYAIVIKTPPYKDQCLSRPEQVKMQLQRQNDSSETSNPMPFIYMPEDPEPMDVDDNIPFNLLASSQFTPTTSSIRTTDNTGIGNMTINVDSLKAQLLSLPENLQNKLLYLYAMQKLQQERAQQQTSSQDFDLSAASSPGLHSNMGVILNDIPMNQSANPEHDTAIFR